VAEQPGQTINIDLLFVPEQHLVQERLPSVSGSSGHLVVGRSPVEKERPYWPGLVFANSELGYQEAMNQYIVQIRDRLEHRGRVRESKKEDNVAWRDDWQARSDRYVLRKQRKQQDADWKILKTEHHNRLLAFQSRSQPNLQQQLPDDQQTWKISREQRRKILQQRKQEDQAWHARNQERKSQLSQKTWIAMLAVVDNCSRQCLGLPVFCSGSHITSEEVVAALRTLLPESLDFLISDQGTHFRTKVFAQLAKEEDFIHVPIYRHRPETNGIAERFVLTIKDWLYHKSWLDAQSLQAIICEFIPYYNDRPHQGLPIPGLSPNEFANRFWSF